MTLRSDNYAPVLPVKVSRPYFSTRPQGAREKLGVWGRDYRPSGSVFAYCKRSKTGAGEGHRLITRTGIGNAIFTFHHPCNALFSAFSVLPLRSFVQYEADLAQLSVCRWLDATLLLHFYAIHTTPPFNYALQLNNQLIIHAEMFTCDKCLLSVCTSLSTYSTETEQLIKGKLLWSLNNIRGYSF